ncbi:MAG: DUF4143 domain-containing protein [Kiritimatiellae bacterium]|nr:DUF4143 domain-containing protein [Kiritimatiellia bacterium]
MRKFRLDWLPGRVYLERLYPLTWQEIKTSQQQVHQLEDILVYGALPGLLAEPDIDTRKEQLNAYTHLYLDEEIRAEAATRNLPRFTQFLRLTALESGSAPNFSKIGQQIGTSHTTIREYFQILQDTLILHELKAFEKTRNRVLKSSRYFFFDTGVRNSAAQLPLEKGLLNLEMGRLFDHFVVLEAIAHFQKDFELSYYRDKAGQKVDLILEDGTKRIAVKIKATQRPLSRHFKGLETFSKEYECDQTLLICKIERPKKFGAHLALPWEQFSQLLAR